ncbi:MAG: hypothetical protein AAB300_03855 [Nitrospirota bacterium]
MLHRLKLRLLYGAFLNQDKAAKKRQWRYILLSGFAVYPPFFAIAYLIYSETRTIAILIIGLLSALTCIPVAFYGYAQGFGAPFLTLFRERREEFLWLGIKIGFFYPLFLYFMILGLVEYLFGYGVVRAAMISFVATAVARDGFEIGYYRARFPDHKIDIFPDGKSICVFLKSDLLSHMMVIASCVCLIWPIGFIGGIYIEKMIGQIIFMGIIVGALVTFCYARLIAKTAAETAAETASRSLIRFFLWPGVTMAITYFIGLLYIYREMLKIQISPAADLAILMAICVAWLILETQFIGQLKRQLFDDAKRDEIQSGHRLR